MISPGASSVPANRLPIITVSAPAASALATSPEYLMPPSATIATPEPRLDASLAVAADTDRRADPQPTELVGRCGGMGLGLLDVADRDQPLEPAGAVDHQQLLDAVLVQEVLGLVDLHAVLHRHGVLG